MPGIIQYPPQQMTRFSDLFSPRDGLGGGKLRAFKRLRAVLESTDEDDPRLASSEAFEPKRGISLNAGTKFTWDMDLINRYCEDLKFPEKPDDYVVLEVAADGEEWTPYYYAELARAEVNLSESERNSLKGDVNQAMGVLMAILIYWRDPYAVEKPIAESS